MTTHHFGTDINGGLVFEDPASVTTPPPRLAAGVSVPVVDGSAPDPTVASLLTPIVTQDDGYWSYTTTDIPSIWIKGENATGGVQWMGPFYSREAQATPHYSKAEADARFAAIGSGGGGLTTVASTDITDSTTTGRALLTAANAAAARTAAGAMAASAASTQGAALIAATDQATARSVVGAMGTSDLPLAVATLSNGDVLTYDSASSTWGNSQPQTTTLPTYLVRGTVLNPGQSVPGDWPDGAIAFVRSVAPTLAATTLGKNGVASSSTTCSVTITDSVSIGDVIYVSVTAAAPGTVLSTMTVADSSTGGTANTYVMRAQRLQGSTIQAQAFSVKATSALAVGATITVTVGAALGDIEMQATKITGTAATIPFDQTGQASNSNASSLAVSTGGATSQANEIALLTLHWPTSTTTVVDPATWAQAGWTQVGTTQTTPSGTTFKNVATFARTLTAAGTISVTPQLSASVVFVALLNTYKAAS